jgi:hypothetical protein
LVLRDAPLEELLRAALTVARGAVYFDPALGTSVGVAGAYPYGGGG